MKIAVHRACAADAVEACEVLRRSIVELCIADHHQDQQVLAAWLQNKTPQTVAAWINSATHFAVVAVAVTGISGFGLIQRQGEIQLCYVAPELVRRGAGRLLIWSLERQAAQWGLNQVFLTSTLTAKSFYEKLGYLAASEPIRAFGLQQAFPMFKPLAG